MAIKEAVGAEHVLQMSPIREPMGYVDGANLYQFVQSNPLNKVDPTGLASLLIHEATAGRASGHAALVIDNPVKAGLPGKYPSGRAVLSWQGDKQGTVQTQFG